MNNDNKKCTTCKCFRKLEEFEVDRFGVHRKGCNTCKQRRLEKTPAKPIKMCIHNIRKGLCIECKNKKEICEHERVKYVCRDCKGLSRCYHEIIRRQCPICDPGGYLKMKTYTQISNAFRSPTEESKLKVPDHLGCTIAEFREHIEKQFKEGMTWGDRSSWHIDHIIAIKAPGANGKPSIEEIIERLHFTNCQPLWAMENMR